MDSKLRCPLIGLLEACLILVCFSQVNDVLAHSEDCKNGDFCDAAGYNAMVSNMTDLMTDFTLVMDSAVEEDAEREKMIKSSFLELLSSLESLETDGKASLYSSATRDLLMSAIRGILKSRSNIIKDQMARNSLSEIWPGDVEKSATWVNSLLRHLLDSRLFSNFNPTLFKAVQTALLEATRLGLHDIVDLLLNHVNATWSRPESAISLATELLPISLTAHSWTLTGKFLDLAYASLTVVEQVNHLRTPCPLLTSHASTWHVAETMCSHFSRATFLRMPSTIPASCVTCPVHGWLIARLVNLSIAEGANSQQLVKDKTDVYCQAVAPSQQTVNQLPNLLPKATDRIVDGSKSMPSGGWKQGTYLFSADDTCALPRFTWDGITAETFNNLVELSLPFLVVNTEPMHSVLRKLFTRENTDKLFSTVDLLTGHIPYGEVFGLYGGMATGKEMLEYIDGLWKKYAFTARQWEKQGGRAMLGDEPPLYIFDSSILQETFNKSGSGFPYPLPGFLPEWRKQVHQFIWGPPGSGSPVHYHCPALNIMAYGRKRWTLYPPASAHYSTVHPLHVRTRPQTPRYKPEPLACVQHAGEMLFIPKHWAHSTVNLDQAIGIAVEFDLPFC